MFRTGINMASNYIKKVAIVGAGGNIGSHMTTSLLATGKHQVTAIARADSTSQLPTSVHRAIVDYSKPDTIVQALRGQDALIITINFFAAKDLSTTLVEAAAEAGVPWILPNEWAPDSAHEGLVRDISSLRSMPPVRERIKELGKSSYLAVSCGLWYEWCLATPVLFGIDIKEKKATLFDDGERNISTSTLPQVGKAVAALLSLPVYAEDGKCLNAYRNGHVYVSSFCVSQKEMLESVYRVTGTKETEWSISKKPVMDYFNTGVEARKIGNMRNEGRKVYSRVFFDDDAGNFEKRHGTANEMLGLPKEDLDEATKLAVERNL